MKVTVHVEGEVPVSADEIRRVLQHAMEAESVDLDLSVAIVDDAAIHRLNREFLNHDYPTDVISFDLRGEDVGPDGELVVSYTTALREATDRGGDPTAELLFYCVHGVLHLLGWNDSDADEREAMLMRQSSLLQEVGYEVAP
jgi:probable rRNA maturation factor